MPLITCNALRKDPRRLHILLVEDRVVDQKAVACILENQGYTVALATHGKEALAMLLQPYDLVLINVQVPEMQGIEVATAIRAQERHRGGHVPIVAMMANAMEGDRERCLKAGPDAYIAKPCKADELLATIEALVLQPSATDPTPRPTRHPQTVDACAPKNTETILSWEVGLSVVEGDEELYRDLLVIFRDSAPMQLENLQEALRAGNIAVVEREAHSLKSAAANIGARAVSEMARHLEYAAKQGDVAAVHCFSDQLRVAFQELLAFLDASGGEDDVV